MHIRGIRGATSVEANTAEAILEAARELLVEIVRRNGVEPYEVAAVIFTATGDLDAAFPAEAGRLLGWTHVPLLSAREIDVPGAPPRTIRVLLLWNTPRAQEEIVHVYLREAVNLRPDLARGQRPTP
ncbi:MAG: chorismate mutase [Armatimonadota bacterium]|nr:chorismate mutase [Armatimonadota bacterium]MDR7449544.1 chorismate mutase [Armatimonadota bacterium]MDR7460062.1 chorismate mutase [Armatimonadota bacterium]MDR7478697.1 chorismate mutase [Armatimonadota bacterium]MDR7487975.1 chorismate mutase [Armatimonadota bacterium]